MTDTAHTPTPWPSLMAYIANRNTLDTATAWCAKLRIDQCEALAGGLASVAHELEAAQTSYAEAQRAKGQSGYPYNSAMGEFLGLPLKANREPGHGYYMAGQILDAFKTGEAQRKVATAIIEGKPLKIVAARAKKTRQPIRFYTFAGPDQIKIIGNGIECSDGKRKIRLSSNHNQASCLEAVQRALYSGNAYGEGA